MKIKLLTASSILCVVATPVFSEETIDASDLTRADTTAVVSASNKGEVKLTGSLAYQFDNGQTAMTLAEGTIDADGNYSDSRVQYFHVFNLDSAITPRIAASLDIIDTQNFTTAALGGIAMMQTPYQSLTFFARGGVLAGDYDEDFAQAFGVQDTAIVGGMAAFYAVLKTGQDGSFLAAYPEITVLDGDLSMETTKMTWMAATPFSADGKRWGQIKIENTSGKIETDYTQKDINSDTKVWFNYKIFF